MFESGSGRVKGTKTLKGLIPNKEIIGGLSPQVPAPMHGKRIETRENTKRC